MIIVSSMAAINYRLYLTNAPSCYITLSFDDYRHGGLSDVAIVTTPRTGHPGGH